MTDDTTVRRTSNGRKAVWLAIAVAVVLLGVGGMFGWQQWRLNKLEAQWQGMAPGVTIVEQLNTKIRKYRPWYDESFRAMTILKTLTEAFPEDGSVSAKSIEIRDRAGVLALVKEVRPDAIVHAAAQPSHDRAAAIPFDDFDTNAMGTLNLLALLLHLRRRVEILPSDDDEQRQAHGQEEVFLVFAHIRAWPAGSGRTE